MGARSSVEEFIEKYNKLWADVGRELSSELWFFSIPSTRDRHAFSLNSVLEKIFQKKEFVLEDEKTISLGELFKFVTYSAVLSLQILLTKLVYFFANRKISSTHRKKILFRTYAYKKNWDFEEGVFNDPFWFAIPENDEHVKVVIPLGCFRESLKFSKNSQRLFLIYSFNSIFDPWEYIVLGVSEALKFPKQSFDFQGVELRRVIEKEWKRGALSISAMMAYTQYRAVSRVAEQMQPKKFFVSYEGLIWDKAAMLGVRKYSENTRIIGYQHTVVPTSALNYFLDADAIDPVPDVLFTTGTRPAAVIKKYDRKISDVREGVALRYSSFGNTKLVKPVEKKRVLLALEGVLHVEPMIRYVLKELADSEWEVCMRPHPILDWNTIAKKLNLSALPKNFNVSSDNSLEKDLEESFCVIYWGSTVALEALQKGLPVIHFENGSLLSFDPLEELKNKLHVRVSESDKLVEKLDQIYGFSRDDIRESTALVRNELKEFFGEVSSEQIEKFLEA